MAMVSTELSQRFISPINTRLSRANRASRQPAITMASAATARKVAGQGIQRNPSSRFTMARVITHFTPSNIEPQLRTSQSVPPLISSDMTRLISVGSETPSSVRETSLGKSMFGPQAIRQTIKTTRNRPSTAAQRRTAGPWASRCIRAATPPDSDCEPDSLPVISATGTSNFSR